MAAIPQEILDKLATGNPVFITHAPEISNLISYFGGIAVSTHDAFNGEWENKGDIEKALTGRNVVFVADAEMDFFKAIFKAEKKVDHIRSREDVQDAISLFPSPATQQQAEQKPAGKKELPWIDEPTFQNILFNHGIDVAWNTLSSELEVTRNSAALDDWFDAKDKGIEYKVAAHVLHTHLRTSFKGVQPDWVEKSLMHAALRNSYNPMVDWIEHAKWDGVDRLPQVYSLLGLEQDDWLSRELIHLWLKQGIVLFHNTEEKHISGEAVLVLVGEQGNGKTTFFEHLAMRPEWFRAGQSIGGFDKDNPRRALTTGICELGELETTLKKADCEALKNFITQPFDEYRLAYGRYDIRSPRHTLLAGTANTDDFLVDTTGNRRFWLVPVHRRIPREELEALDATQLWAQIYKQSYTGNARTDAAAFRPDAKTREALEQRNSAHRKMQKGETEVRDILDSITSENRGKYSVIWISATAWAGLFVELDRFAPSQVGRCLATIGFEKKRCSAGMLYLLPVPDSLKKLIK